MSIGGHSSAHPNPNPSPAGSGRSADWKKATCPNHTSLINKAVNTAKATTIVANTHKMKQAEKAFQQEIKETVQKAEDAAYGNIIKFVSGSGNVIIWNNVNIVGKKIKLVSEKLQNTSIGIKNIQVYGKDSDKDEMRLKVHNRKEIHMKIEGN